MGKTERPVERVESLTHKECLLRGKVMKRLSQKAVKRAEHSLQRFFVFL